MPHRFEDYVEKANLAKTSDELKNFFIETLACHGIDKMMLCLETDHPYLNRKAGSSVVHNISEDFLAHYRENDFEKIDPVLIYSRLHHNPFKWTDVIDNMKLSKKQINIIDSAVESGLNHGMYFPMTHGTCRAGMGLASSVKHKDFTHQFDILTAYCYHFYEAFGRLERQSNFIEKWVLTSKEVEVLTWAAHGKTDYEIADKLNISNNTVETHLKNIYQKLEAPNRTSAVAKALSKKFIDFR